MRTRNPLACTQTLPGSETQALPSGRPDRARLAGESVPLRWAAVLLGPRPRIPAADAPAHCAPVPPPPPPGPAQPGQVRLRARLTMSESTCEPQATQMHTLRSLKCMSKDVTSLCPSAEQGLCARNRVRCPRARLCPARSVLPVLGHLALLSPSSIAAAGPCSGPASCPPPLRIRPSSGRWASFPALRMWWPSWGVASLWLVPLSLSPFPPPTLLSLLSLSYLAARGRKKQMTERTAPAAVPPLSQERLQEGRSRLCSVGLLLPRCCLVRGLRTLFNPDANPQPRAGGIYCAKALGPAPGTRAGGGGGVRETLRSPPEGAAATSRPEGGRRRRGRPAPSMRRDHAAGFARAPDHARGPRRAGQAP